MLSGCGPVTTAAGLPLVALARFFLLFSFRQGLRRRTGPRRDGDQGLELDALVTVFDSEFLLRLGDDLVPDADDVEHGTRDCLWKFLQTPCRGRGIEPSNFPAVGNSFAEMHGNCEVPCRMRGGVGNVETSTRRESAGKHVSRRTRFRVGGEVLPKQSPGVT